MIRRKRTHLVRTDDFELAKPGDPVLTACGRVIPKAGAGSGLPTCRRCTENMVAIGGWIDD